MNKSTRQHGTGDESSQGEQCVLVPGGFNFFDYMATKQRIRDHAAVEGGPTAGIEFYLPVVTVDTDRE